MVVIKISYPHQHISSGDHHRFGNVGSHRLRPSYNHSLTSSASVSPTLTDSSSEPLPSLLQVSPDGDTLATSKQEEWVTKRKTELVTTKQIETRVKRQVVLEDGKVVEDSGPLVTTTTTEDTDKNESEHTEHKQHGDEPDLGDGWVAIESVPDDAVVKETNERKITTHDEVEDILETEEVKHLGDVTSQSIVRAILEGDRKGGLSERDRRELVSSSAHDRDSAQKRILQQSRRHDRTTDIEDTNEVSKVNEKGNLVTEITKRHEHEVFHNEDIPDSDSDEFEHIENREGSHDYSHAKNENFIEYLNVPRGSPLSQGVKVGEGARLVSENISSERQGDEDLWDSVSERFVKTPKPDSPQGKGATQVGAGGVGPGSRSDALTSRPLDFDQEEHTRKHETNRWLNSHFGSSSSSLSSEASPRSPIQVTPKGIHVTMTSRSSPLHPSPPPPPPLPGSTAFRSALSPSGQKPYSNGKRITFEDSPSPRPSPTQKDVHFDLKHRHEDVMRSLNSQFGRARVTKSGSSWEDEQLRPTPTPPPRTRRRNSPDTRNVRTPDQTSPSFNQSTTMNSARKFRSSPQPDTAYLQKSNDIGERKAYERREQSFGYSGPGQQPLGRETFESGNFGDSGYVTKHSNYYRTDETNNPAQNSLYDNGEAEVTERRTVDRREKTFSYDGPSQKQFHPKYILGVPNSTMNRLKGIEGTGAMIEEDPRHTQTLPRRRFYFGDEEGSLLNKHQSLEARRSNGSVRADKESPYGGTDDINVSISNKYNNVNDVRKSSSLNRSMSFTPRSLEREKATRFSNTESVFQSQKNKHVYNSNPQLVDSPDLLSPRLITSISRSSRDVTSPIGRSHFDRNDQVYSNRVDTSNVSRSRRTFLENVKKNSSDLYEPMHHGTKASSPSRSMTPTYSPNSRALAPRLSNSPRPFGGTNSPALSDDYQETYRMTSNTPDNDISKPRISTDTTSKFSRRTLRGQDGTPQGKLESTETTTRTKSRFKESEVSYPNGRRVGSPASFRTDFQPQTTSGGSVIIPVRDTNNNKHVHYAH